MNELAAIVPEAYKLQKSRYLGREAVLDAPISPAGPSHILVAGPIDTGG